MRLCELESKYGPGGKWDGRKLKIKPQKRYTDGHTEARELSATCIDFCNVRS